MTEPTFDPIEAEERFGERMDDMPPSELLVMRRDTSTWATMDEVAVDREQERDMANRDVEMPDTILPVNWPWPQG